MAEGDSPRVLSGEIGAVEAGQDSMLEQRIMEAPFDGTVVSVTYTPADYLHHYVGDEGFRRDVQLHKKHQDDPATGVVVATIPHGVFTLERGRAFQMELVDSGSSVDIQKGDAFYWSSYDRGMHERGTPERDPGGSVEVEFLPKDQTIRRYSPEDTVSIFLRLRDARGVGEVIGSFNYETLPPPKRPTTIELSGHGEGRVEANVELRRRLRNMPPGYYKSDHIEVRDTDGNHAGWFRPDPPIRFRVLLAETRTEDATLEGWQSSVGR